MTPTGWAPLDPFRPSLLFYLSPSKLVSFARELPRNYLLPITPLWFIRDARLSTYRLFAMWFRRTYIPHDVKTPHFSLFLRVSLSISFCTGCILESAGKLKRIYVMTKAPCICKAVLACAFAMLIEPGPAVGQPQILSQREHLLYNSKY